MGLMHLQHIQLDHLTSEQCQFFHLLVHLQQPVRADLLAQHKNRPDLLQHTQNEQRFLNGLQLRELLILIKMYRHRLPVLLFQKDVLIDLGVYVKHRFAGLLLFFLLS